VDRPPSETGELWIWNEPPLKGLTSVGNNRHKSFIDQNFNRTIDCFVMGPISVKRCVSSLNCGLNNVRVDI